MTLNITKTVVQYDTNTQKKYKVLERPNILKSRGLSIVKMDSEIAPYLASTLGCLYIIIVINFQCIFYVRQQAVVGGGGHSFFSLR